MIGQPDTSNDTADLLYGMQAIADFLRVKRSVAYHLAATDKIPTFELGKTVCARRSKILAALDGLDSSGHALTNKVPLPRREFSQRLRMLRVAGGFDTAREFFRALQIQEDRYTRWERAETEPDICHLLRICQVLRIDPNELLSPLIGRG
jgi:hypothetical protein